MAAKSQTVSCMATRAQCLSWTMFCDISIYATYRTVIPLELLGKFDSVRIAFSFLCVLFWGVMWRWVLLEFSAFAFRLSFHLFSICLRFGFGGKFLIFFFFFPFSSTLFLGTVICRQFISVAVTVRSELLLWIGFLVSKLKRPTSLLRCVWSTCKELHSFLFPSGKLS